MDNQGKDIRDNEFRVIGHDSRLLQISEPEGEAQRSSSPASPRPRNAAIAAVSAVIVIAIGILVVGKWPREAPEDPDSGFFENTPETVAPSGADPLGMETEESFTERLDTVINDVHLALYIPHNAVPELTLGVPDRRDNSLMLAAQAADIRKDNGKILGAFVLKGQPLAWGLSKKGFCAIIDTVVTVGYSENSPLFEEATEKGGYFFRQYPLVDNGVLVENGPKNKTMRKALCSRAGELFVAVSETDESMHDFAQSLVDLGVENAIYLVGSHSSFGWYIDASGTKTLFGVDRHRPDYKNETYIIWRSAR